MNKVNVMYVTEEEKRAILRQRLEAERKANRKRMSANQFQHMIAGIIMAIMAIVTFYLSIKIDGEFIIFTIVCGFMSLVCFGAREEETEWVEQ
jgi:hypothetical protein